MAENDRQMLLRQIFHAASALPPNERAALLDDACRGDDADLRDEIEKLLHDHDELGDFLATGAQSRDAGQQDASIAASGFIGRRIGNFKIRRLIATGGMGSVFEAVQENPPRAVALKIMKTGLLSRTALRRFEYESQVLAHLRHPGVCQIYEAGVDYQDSAMDTKEGVAYFAMEYLVDARPITEFAVGEKLSTRERLELFVKVCEAVSHGHRKGIIHRDLKPSNILVDSSGQPRIIDFGVARSTDNDMAVTTLLTEVGQLVGTLQYMSPEQCDADPHDLDTRSDVYALGVVLYELLSEHLPYEVSSVALYEAAGLVRLAQPIRPSTWNAGLRGDLETITLKALEKDRQRRYQSAAEMAKDIQRYLRNEPISARPPSLTYQLRTFVRRNRTLCILGAMAVLILVLGTVGTSAGMFWALAERDHAIDAEETARQARIEKERIWDETVANFQGRYSDRLERLGPGNVYTWESFTSYLWALRAQGRLQDAETELRRLLALQSDLELSNAFRVGTLRYLAMNLVEQDRLDEAERYGRDALAASEGTVLARFSSLVTLGDILREGKEFQEAESVLLAAWDLQQQALPTQNTPVPSLIALYSAWDAAEPGKGYDAKAVQWQERSRKDKSEN